jgi:hypothetical protein
MNNTKFNWRAYWSPTPVLFRKIGDALLYTFGTAAIPAALAGEKWIAVAFFAAAMFGKLITNFFKDDSAPFV